MTYFISGIHNTQNIYDNRIFPKKVHFCGLQQDTFVKGENAEAMHKKYFQSSNIIPKEDLLKEFSRKTEIMPLIMDRTLRGVANYIAGEIEVEEFLQNFLNDTTSLATRIAIGKDKEEYCENYQPEISLIKSISGACSDFSNGDINKTELDEQLEKQIINYSQKDFKRNKLFFA